MAYGYSRTLKRMGWPRGAALSLKPYYPAALPESSPATPTLLCLQ